MIHGLSASVEVTILPAEQYKVRVKILDLDGGERGFVPETETDMATAVSALYLLRSRFNLPVEFGVMFAVNQSGDDMAALRLQQYLNTGARKQLEAHALSETGTRHSTETDLLEAADRYLSDTGLLDAAKTVTTLQ